MDNKKAALPEIVNWIFGDFSDKAIGVVTNGFSRWRQHRESIARDVILSHVRQGDINALHTDELFSMLARFLRSVHEGQAKSNLILLARLISGIGKVDKELGQAETFNQYSNMLESLTKEEIVVISDFIKTGELIAEEEVKQSLQYKGFFVSQTSSKVTTQSNIIIRRWDGNESAPHSAKSLAEEQNNKKNAHNTYDVDTTIEYLPSKKLTKLINTYGNIWEDISRWVGEENK